MIKRQCGFTQVRYRGVAKNDNYLFAEFAVVNIVLAKRRLQRLAQVQCARSKLKDCKMADATK